MMRAQHSLQILDFKIAIELFEKRAGMFRRHVDDAVIGIRQPPFDRQIHLLRRHVLLFQIFKVGTVSCLFELCDESGKVRGIAEAGKILRAEQGRIHGPDSGADGRVPGNTALGHGYYSLPVTRSRM